MSQKKKSQVIMLDHSKAKVLLLQKYLEKYLNIITNDGYTQKINVFDLFCGEGIYENSGEGSPIAILRTLKDLHFINKAKNKDIIKVDLYFNDKDEFKIQKLSSIIEEKKLHYNTFGKVTYSSKDYKAIIDNLSSYIQNLKNEKAFVFIDPYGYKEIRASEIKKLLQSKKSEVLLFLPTQFMYRFDEKGTPEALIQIIEELVDIKNWKRAFLFINLLTSLKMHLKIILAVIFSLILLLLKRMQQLFSVFSFFQVILEDSKKC